MSNLTVDLNVPASEQESSFMNAALTTLDDGSVISIAIFAPAGYTCDDVVQELRGLAGAGWTVRIQHGPEDQMG